MEVFVPLAPFIMVIAIVGFVYYFGHKNRKAVLETVRIAAQNGAQLTPEVIRELGASGRKARQPHQGLRSGVVLLAVAAAMIVLGFGLSAVENDQQILPILASAAAFPGFIGLALIALGVLMPEKATDDDPHSGAP